MLVYSLKLHPIYIIIYVLWVCSCNWLWLCSLTPEFHHVFQNTAYCMLIWLLWYDSYDTVRRSCHLNYFSMGGNEYFWVFWTIWAALLIVNEKFVKHWLRLINVSITVFFLFVFLVFVFKIINLPNKKGLMNRLEYVSFW